MTQINPSLAALTCLRPLANPQLQHVMEILIPCMAVVKLSDAVRACYVSTSCNAVALTPSGCRHRSILFKVVADNLKPGSSVPSRLVRGRFQDQPHVWNVIRWGVTQLAVTSSLKIAVSTSRYSISFRQGSWRSVCFHIIAFSLDVQHACQLPATAVAHHITTVLQILKQNCRGIGCLTTSPVHTSNFTPKQSL